MQMQVQQRAAAPAAAQQWALPRIHSVPCGSLRPLQRGVRPHNPIISNSSGSGSSKEWQRLRMPLASASAEAAAAAAAHAFEPADGGAEQRQRLQGGLDQGTLGALQRLCSNVCVCLAAAAAWAIAASALQGSAGLPWASLTLSASPGASGAWLALVAGACMNTCASTHGDARVRVRACTHRPHAAPHCSELALRVCAFPALLARCCTPSRCSGGSAECVGGTGSWLLAHPLWTRPPGGARVWRSLLCVVRAAALQRCAAHALAWHGTAASPLSVPSRPTPALRAAHLPAAGADAADHWQGPRRGLGAGRAVGLWPLHRAADLGAGVCAAQGVVGACGLA